MRHPRLGAFETRPMVTTKVRAYKPPPPFLQPGSRAAARARAADAAAATASLGVPARCRLVVSNGGTVRRSRPHQLQMRNGKVRMVRLLFMLCPWISGDARGRKERHARRRKLPCSPRSGVVVTWGCSFLCRTFAVRIQMYPGCTAAGDR